jgi:hypothetical protein
MATDAEVHEMLRRLREAVQRPYEPLRTDELLNGAADLICDLFSLLLDVAQSGVSLTDPGLKYVEVQIDVTTWNALRELVGVPECDRCGVPMAHHVLDHLWECDCGAMADSDESDHRAVLGDTSTSLDIEGAEVKSQPEDLNSVLGDTPSKPMVSVANDDVRGDGKWPDAIRELLSDDREANQ